MWGSFFLDLPGRTADLAQLEQLVNYFFSIKNYVYLFISNMFCKLYMRYNQSYIRYEFQISNCISEHILST